MRVAKELKNIQAVIDKLESKGYEVELEFLPEMEGIVGPVDGDVEYAFKGATFMSVYANGEYVAEGVAACSVNDRFDKITGTVIAFRRLMTEFGNALGRDGLKKLLE